jgi:hypothetical protein
VRAVALLYRRLVILVGSQWGVGVVEQLVAAGLPPNLEPVVGLAALACQIVLAVYLVMTAYRLMKHLGSRNVGAWAVLMFVPCVNILALLAISSRAQAWCKSRGIKVGILGPTQESLDRLGRP